jgi:hypothetical protein
VGAAPNSAVKASLRRVTRAVASLSVEWVAAGAGGAPGVSACGSAVEELGCRGSASLDEPSLTVVVDGVQGGVAWHGECHGQEARVCEGMGCAEGGNVGT